jgi:hypothetical protein
MSRRFTCPRSSLVQCFLQVAKREKGKSRKKYMEKGKRKTVRKREEEGEKEWKQINKEFGKMLLTVGHFESLK